MSVSCRTDFHLTSRVTITVHYHFNTTHAPPLSRVALAAGASVASSPSARADTSMIHVMLADDHPVVRSGYQRLGLRQQMTRALRDASRVKGLQRAQLIWKQAAAAAHSDVPAPRACSRINSRPRAPPGELM